MVLFRRTISEIFHTTIDSIELFTTNDYDLDYDIQRIDNAYTYDEITLKRKTFVFPDFYSISNRICVAPLPGELFLWIRILIAEFVLDF